jgi:glycosyltransferase involved in cell wall biosynthesis
MPKLSVIMPCYFNEQNMPVTTAELIANEKNFDPDIEFEYVMVDDGSKDNTLKELLKFKEQYPDKVRVVKLSGNFGAYNAILAGMKHATGEMNVVLTADLQDPPELIPKMVGYWKKGVKLVIANREDREEPWMQKKVSNFYHKLMKKIALKNIPEGGFDLILFDRQLRDEVVRIDEKNTNTLYLLTWLQYDYVCIPYTRRKRQIGKSRWTLQKKVKLFIDSFVSFSFFPIRMISVFGVIFGLIAFIYGLFIIVAKIFGLIPVQGWATVMAVILFVSSFQMLALGVLGEYIWRTLDASRNRPNYIVEKVF